MYFILEIIQLIYQLKNRASFIDFISNIAY